MKKVLFIDRDGTLIVEPPEDYQVDSLEKLSYLPGVFNWLGRIAQQLDYELVMVTNQDGLGTDSFPEKDFWPAHEKMMEALRNEGIVFREVLIDRSFPEDEAPTRKPGTALLTHYLNGDYDLENSFVIGDRESDLALASNLRARSIWLVPEEQTLQGNVQPDFRAAGWQAIYEWLAFGLRVAVVKRSTRETEIRLRLNLDGTGKSEISTGLGFFDHMLDQICRHALLDLNLTTKGDLHVDEHHTIEDTALALGSAFYQALGDKRGVMRYGFALPMDEAQARVAIDFGGRPWLNWEVDFRREMIGQVPTEMWEHFFHSFADAARCTLHIQAEGKNEHHLIEAVFKAFAKTVQMAIRRDIDRMILPSTKGLLA